MVANAADVTNEEELMKKLNDAGIVREVQIALSSSEHSIGAAIFSTKLNRETSLNCHFVSRTVAFLEFAETQLVVPNTAENDWN